jgi:WD repeat and SOF domain-containing protein 1
MFAKPFLAQLGRGHVDGVYNFAKDPNALERFASGSGDGVVKVWDLTSRDEVWQTKAHENIVKGLCFTLDKKLLTCGGVDRTIALHDPYNQASGSKPLSTYQGKNAFTGISHHRESAAFAASHSAGISIYDLSRPTSAPINNLTWPTSVDTVSSVSFNLVETSILASTASDRSITLYDLRTSSPLRRVILQHASNAIAWNPMEAFNFAVANEDHNIYIFDSRTLGSSTQTSAGQKTAAPRALNVLKDHVAAVMDVSFSPTGENLVTASYDRTIRLWDRNKGHSKDIYHTKRMQRVFCATYTPDAQYVLSGSDDGNIRLWRAQASSRQGVVSARQRQALEYADALKERYKHMPEIKRIARHRHVPRTIKKAGEIKKDELESIRRREENRRKHEKKTVGKDARRSEREKMVITTEG